MDRRRFASFVLIVPLLALLACKGSPSPPMTGSWESTYDEHTKAKLTITQDGNKVTGSYTGDQNTGTMEGTVDGKTVTGTWKEGDTPALRGTFRWTLDRDGTGFAGSYESEDKKHAGKWTGVKF